MFVGNDIGVYVSIDAGQSWERLGDNMPYIPVYDMELNEKNNELIAGTFARSIQTFNLDRLTKQNVSVKENLANNYSIFPNPATQLVTIISDPLSSSEGQLLVYDIYGREIYRMQQGNQKQMVLDVSKFANGIYIILLQTAGKSSAGKMIKE